MKIILHVGMAKTGSSSIQETFSGRTGPGPVYLPLGGINHGPWCFQQFQDEDEIASGPEFQRSGLGREELLSRRARDFAKLEAFLDNQRPETLLISGEALATPRAEAVAHRLRGYFLRFGATFEVRGYIRPPVAYINSAYQQRLQGMAREQLVFGVPGTFYHGGLAFLDEVFGREAVHLKPLMAGYVLDDDVVRDFARDIGVELAPEDIIRSNESLSLEAAALLYVTRFHGSAYRKGYPLAPRENRDFVDLLRRVPGRRRLSLGPDLVRPFLDASRDDIAWMEARLGVKLEAGESGHPPNVLAYEDLADIALSQHKAVDDLIAVRMTEAPDAADVLRRLLGGNHDLAALAGKLDGLRRSFNRADGSRGEAL